ncbi:MAG: XylR family transcriptional regulator [Planctomycetaceae bacterium]|nr:XylR family transcriptional regulator [Planctomycetaceae bacterium]
MRPRYSVALLIETSNGYARGLLEGIIDYVHRHEAWSIYLPEQERGARPPNWLSRWKGDGLIARIETEDVARVVRRSRLPAVDVSAARRVPGIPWVETDDRAIARLAAEHLLQRGFRQLGFCGDPGFNWSLWREEYFKRIVEDAGCECYLHQSLPVTQPGYSWNREKRRLAQWVSRLPRPIGIMACYDIKAQQLLDVCRELNVAVPEEIAVVGVDNDRLLCDLASPPLTSVIPNTHRTGYEAAELLDRLMAGKRVKVEAHLIEPLGVQVRQSSDTLAIDDPEIAAAVRFIREYATTGINVSDVLQRVPLSRRVLESRFRRIVNRTPHEEMMRVRIERVKRLLTDTTISLAAIAARTGFEHVEYLSVAFKREVGQTPRQYRESVRAPGT